MSLKPAAFRTTAGILDKSLSRGKSEISISTFSLLFSEMVQYSQNRVNTVAELQSKLAEFGSFVGVRLLDVIVLRERGYKRETKLLNMLMLLKSTIWRSIFGREADKLERSNDDPCTYLIIEKEPLVNTFISVPKDKGTLNCAAFAAGVIEAILNASNFPAKVTCHWHNGSTYMIKFDESVIARERMLEQR